MVNVCHTLVRPMQAQWSAFMTSKLGDWLRGPGMASHCLLGPHGDRCIIDVNAHELQRRAHEQKINATTTLALLFKRSSAIHKQPSTPTLYSNERVCCLLVPVLPRGRSSHVSRPNFSVIFFPV